MNKKIKFKLKHKNARSVRSGISDKLRKNTNDVSLDRNVKGRNLAFRSIRFEKLSKV